MISQIVLGGVEPQVCADDYQFLEVGMVLKGWAGIGDVKTSQWLKLNKVVAEQMLQIILFLLVRFLLLFLDLLQVLPLRLLLYAERVVSWMF